MEKTAPAPTGEKRYFRPVWTKENMMKRLGYSLISDDGEYAKYENHPGIEVPGYGTMPKGKRVIYFNGGYQHDAVFTCIREDGDSRTVFNGICKNFSEFYGILKAVR